MSIVSYAQNFEDVLLWRALHDVGKGNYLDIGAQDPIVDSVSLAFYQAGWRGVHVEATPAYVELLRKARPDETVIEAAVTDAGGLIPFFAFDGTGISTGVPEIAARHRSLGYHGVTIQVPSIRLDDLLETMAADVHWLKIDVEGMEADVLRSWGDSQRRPWVLVIESTAPLTQTPTGSPWSDEVRQRGYSEVYFDGLNRYFVHEAHDGLRDRFSTPANVFDEFDVARHHFSASLLRSEEESREQWVRDDEAARHRDDIARIQGEAQGLQEAMEDANRALDLSRADQETMVRQLVAAKEEYHVAVDSIWRERREAENALHIEHRAREDKLAETLSLTQAREHAAKVELARLEVQLHQVIERVERADQALALTRASEHAAKVELARLAGKLHQAIERVDQADQELALTRSQLAVSHQSAVDASARADRVKLDMQRQFADAEAELRRESSETLDKLRTALGDAESSGASVRVELIRLQERAAQLEARLARAEEESALSAERLSSALADASNERTQLRTEHANARAAAEQAQAETDRQIARYRTVTERADVLIRAAVAERAGRWQRIGEAIGLSQPPRAWRALSSWSAPKPDQQSTSSATQQPAQESEPAMQSSVPPNARNPYLRADSLAELLSWHDVDFVRCAYVTVLGRQPDPEGEAHFTDRIRRGHPKMEVLWQLRRSPEGPSHDPGIAGFDKMLRRYRNARRPLLGAIIRLFTGRASASAPERQLRALKNHAAVAQQQQALGIAAIELQLGHQSAELNAIRSENQAIHESILQLPARWADGVTSRDSMENASTEPHEASLTCCTPTLGPTAARLYNKIRSSTEAGVARSNAHRN